MKFNKRRKRIVMSDVRVIYVTWSSKTGINIDAQSYFVLCLQGTL